MQLCDLQLAEAISSLRCLCIEKLEEQMRSAHRAPTNPAPVYSAPQHPARLSEYDLITYCAQQGAFGFLEGQSASMTLFYKHFLVMHCLYSLQAEWLKRGLYLKISPLEIEAVLLPSYPSGTALSHMENSLADYYLDINQLKGITEDNVNELIANFWKLLRANDTEAVALRTLGLTDSADWLQIQRKYRQLVASAHPDKGGKQEDFIRIQQAFEALAVKHSGR